MKKIIIAFSLLAVILSMFCITNKVYAADQVIDDQTKSKLIEIKETQAKSLKDYQDKYGSDTYGFVAYVLNIVRIYSIPFCFLGITIGAIHRYVIGVRRLDALQNGMGLMVAFVTLLVIAQVLPLAFALFIRFGRV